MAADYADRFCLLTKNVPRWARCGLFCGDLLLAAVAGAAAFAPVSMVPRSATGVTGLCMSAGTGVIKQVAAFRGAASGKAGLPPQGSDPSSINLDLVNGVANPNDTVGGVDTTYSKPPSTFFSKFCARLFLHRSVFVGPDALEYGILEHIFGIVFPSSSFHKDAQSVVGEKFVA